MTANSFHGFPRDLPRYLARLEKNNNKPWFERNRGDYESLFVEPAKQFVSAMAAALCRIVPDVKGEPRINGSIM